MWSEIGAQLEGPSLTADGGSGGQMTGAGQLLPQMRKAENGQTQDTASPQPTMWWRQQQATDVPFRACSFCLCVGGIASCPRVSKLAGCTLPERKCWWPWPGQPVCPRAPLPYAAELGDCGQPRANEAYMIPPSQKACRLSQQRSHGLPCILQETFKLRSFNKGK